MKNTIQKLMNDLTFNRLLINAGIEPAPLFDINVKDAEIVKESNVERFYKWYANTCNGKYANDINAMARGMHVVATHKINQLNNLGHEKFA